MLLLVRPVKISVAGFCDPATKSFKSGLLQDKFNGTLIFIFVVAIDTVYICIYLVHVKYIFLPQLWLCMFKFRISFNVELVYTDLIISTPILCILTTDPSVKVN